MPAFQFDPSTFNSGNAERVAAEARRLLSRGLPPTEIAIIAAYSAQARRLRELLRAERAAGLEIGTVDGFQGREKEAVIVDLVRSNEHGEIGFLANTRRMNRAHPGAPVLAGPRRLGDPRKAPVLRGVLTLHRRDRLSRKRLERRRAAVVTGACRESALAFDWRRRLCDNRYAHEAM
jgi:hypothetical protein